MGTSDFLFVMPGHLNGSARVLDLAALYDSGSYDESQTPDQADAWAIANDWAVVGNDLESATRQQKAEDAAK